MRARYANGRSAVLHEAECELGHTHITFTENGKAHAWEYDEIARADDNNGRITLRLKPDNGARLYLDVMHEDVLRAAAPHLTTPAAQGVERRVTVAAVAIAAWSLAAVFLVGVPQLAEPIAGVLPDRYRTQIADISWSQVEAFTAHCDDADAATQIVNDVAYRLMQASGVPNRDAIWITIADADFPNAFALPDNSIILTDELIGMASHPDELTGVLAHEIAHIEHNHIMKNVIRQIGAGIFFDVVFGGAGAGQAVAIASVNLAGLRYSREDETDADLRGLDYLDAASIDTGGLARLFATFEDYAAHRGGDIPTLLSSHPASAERAEAARARSRPNLAPSMTPREWRIVQQACGGADALDNENPAEESAGATGED